MQKGITKNPVWRFLLVSTTIKAATYAAFLLSGRAAHNWLAAPVAFLFTTACDAALCAFIILRPLQHLRQQAEMGGSDYFSDIVEERVRKIRQGFSVAREEDLEAYRLQYLANQINPHFLYNTLESIRGKAYCDNNTDIAEMTEAFSAFFRYSISVRSNIVSIGDELNNVRKYFQIQQFRFGERFVLEVNLDTGDSALCCCIPKLTLQPIVENAIVHGLEDQTYQGRIAIRVVETQNRLIINVTDNGKGISQSRLDEINRLFSISRDNPAVNEERRQGKTGGIALKNINDRIRAYFGERYGITIYSTEGAGANVEIVLPKISKDIYDLTESAQRGRQEAAI